MSDTRLGAGALRMLGVGTLAIALAIAAVLAVGATAAQADPTIFPSVNCVTFDPSNNELGVNFGYFSQFDLTDQGEFVPIGDQNFISPNPADRDQTTFFQSGVVPQSWSTTILPSQTPSLTWNLLGNTTTASLDSPECGVTPNAAPQSEGDLSVVGTPAVGQQLVATTGAWLGYVVAPFGFQWQALDSTGTWNDISGANSRTFTPTGNQAGDPLRVEVTANSAGAAAGDGGQSTTADSNPTAPVTPEPSPPSPPSSPLAVRPGALNFGTAREGYGSRPQSILVTNTSRSTQPVGGYLRSGADAGDFDVASGCVGSLRPGRSCALVVDFDPSAKGLRTAQVRVFDTSGNGPAPVTLTGTGR